MRTKHRSLVGITLLTVVTFGIYPIYWYFITKTEMNTVNGRSDKVPFFLWFFVPIVNIWWFWRFAKALEKATKGTLNRWAAFVAPIIFAVIGVLILAIFYPSALRPDIAYEPSLWGSMLILVVSLLPLYYFQSNLNRYAK